MKVEVFTLDTYYVLGVLHHDTRVLFRCSAFSENQLSPKTKRESSLTLYCIYTRLDTQGSEFRKVVFK